MDKSIIFCFSSLHPSGFNKSQLEIREKNYDIALVWLLKTIPNNWDIIYNDNTLEQIDDLMNLSLKNNLKSDRIKVLLHKGNNGADNKGAGEHDMCKKCFNNIDFKQYKWIVYFTARHIIPTPWYFESLEKEWSSFDAIMSNPSFFYLDYTTSTPTKNLYNDMLFSMKSSVFKEFVDSIDVEMLKSLSKNSENHLYEFINNKKIYKKEIEYLGILRNDHQSHGWHLV